MCLKLAYFTLKDIGVQHYRPTDTARSGYTNERQEKKTCLSVENSQVNIPRSLPQCSIFHSTIR